MEIFQTGEMEEEMRKCDYQATSLSCYWNLFTSSYEEAIQSLTCPIRAQYEMDELGPDAFSIDVMDTIPMSLRSVNESQYPPDVDTTPQITVNAVREDFQITNIRGETLECSFWHKSVFLEDGNVPPCIVYLHGMSSSRKEAIYLRYKVLAAGFSLFALDLSGSGKSEGEHVAYGHYEKEDLRAVLDFLYATNKASAVGIWGRCIGGAATLLHLRDFQPFQYKTMTMTKKEALQLCIQEDKETGYLLCARPARFLPFRLTTTSARTGDFVMLSVGTTMVRDMTVETFYQLIQDQPEDRIRIAGYQHQRTASSAISCTFVFALTLDSTFGDMERVIADMLLSITKSAKKRDILFSPAIMTAASKIISRSIHKRAGFQLKDIAVVDDVADFTLPCLFVSASHVDFIRPAHSQALFDRYGGDKTWLPFIGVHDQNRPDTIVDAICTHFTTQLNRSNSCFCADLLTK